LKRFKFPRVAASGEQRLPRVELWIAGLPWTAEEQDVAAFLDEFGEAVEVRLIRERHTGRSRGFCFVTLSMHAGIDVEAWREANGRYIAGRRIIVQLAKEGGREREGKGAPGPGEGEHP
jgi:cold-inducible RNA-binding protein